jgi:Dimerisation domain
MKSEEQPTAEPRALLQEMIDGYRVSQLIFVAAELGIADLLAAGPKHYEQLARETGSSAPALYRLLRALASVGVFTQAGDRFGLNPLAECLRTGTGVRYAPGRASPVHRPTQRGRRYARRSGPVKQRLIDCMA